MATSTIYVPPTRIAVVRHRQFIGQRAAWRLLSDWLDGHALSWRERPAFGLLPTLRRDALDGPMTYDSAVGIGPRETACLGSDIEFDWLQGGAFARYRFVGCPSDFHDAYGVLKQHLECSSPLPLDWQRPALLVFQNPEALLVDEHSTIEVCVPLRPH